MKGASKNVVLVRGFSYVFEARLLNASFVRNATRTSFPQPVSQIHCKTNEILAIVRRGINCSLSLVCDASEMLAGYAFLDLAVKAKQDGEDNVSSE